MCMKEMASFPERQARTFTISALHTLRTRFDRPSGCKLAESAVCGSLQPYKRVKKRKLFDIHEQLYRPCIVGRFFDIIPFFL